MTGGRRAWPAGVVAAALLVVAGLAGGWALRVLLAPAPDVLAAPDYTLVTAQHGSVEQSWRLNTSAEWEPASVAVNQAAGVVTTVVLEAGAVAKPGDVLYTVDLRTVAVAAGAVPAFRDLSHGTKGADVAQLQRLLKATGHYSGRIDGLFDGDVGFAVRAWQRSIGNSFDGLVRRGDLIFVPRLPARLTLTADIVVGATLTGGESAVSVLNDAPTFTIALTDGQAQTVSTGMRVEIDAGGAGGIWPATIADVRQQLGEAGPSGYIAELTGEDSSICGEHCALIRLGQRTLLPSRVILVPRTTGVTVPAAAIVTSARGEVGVKLEDGAFHAVTVVAAASGVAVVKGLAPGDLVRVPGDGDGL